MAIINSTTLPLLLEEANNTMLKRTPFMRYASMLKGVQTYRGASRIEVPVQVRDHSSITSHSTTGYSAGLEPVAFVIGDPLETAVFNWGAWSEPCVISHVASTLNDGKEKRIDLFELLIGNGMDLLARSINSQIVSGTAGSGVAITGLESLYGAAAGVTTGFIEGIAKASQDNVVGGLSKATYNTRGWTNAFGAGAGSFNTNGLVQMNAIFTAIKDVHVGPKPVDLIIASTTSFANYKRALFANERYVDAKVLDGGNMTLSFNGAPVEMDSDMTVTGRAGDAIFSMYFLNFSGIKYYLQASNTKKYQPSQNEDAYLMASLKDYVAPGYAADSKLLFHMGQLVAKHLGSQGILTNADIW